ncbi:cytochrome P450 [Kutzneria sp. CA-103260]|uniref:cytochrome P450 n=1 Tax=Kutzneria sp. CA-103260 TaxID=2802641 RepID=UPI001BAA12AF|nr:cytochrome P450 [Kutzneria sp. CA-103260]QUQ62478.1 cytochrome P450 [Kutzneria sp. CA-103260]
MPLAVAARVVGGVRRILTPTGHPAWLATTYADVWQVLSDPRFGKAPLTDCQGSTRSGRLLPGLLFTTDGLEHKALRTELLAAMRLCPSRSLLDDLADQADSLLSAAGDAGDLVASYAAPLAIWAVGTWLGLPVADWSRCAELSSIVLSLNQFPADVVEQAQFELLDYFDGMLASHSERSDLLSALAATAASPAPLAATVLATGYETLVAGIANAALTLLTHNGFGSWPSSRVDTRRLVDELLRFAPLGGTMRSRCALVDVPVGDVLVGRGEIVLAATGPANRDPSRFSDPDAFCPARKDNRHVAFGVGERFCAGSQLAVMGLSVALERIAARFPGVRLAVEPGALRILPGAAEPRPVELPVHWV